MIRRSWNRLVRFIYWHYAALKWAAIACLTLMVGVVSVLQFWIFPRLDSYRPRIAAEISEAVGRKVEIAHMRGGWRGVRPYVEIDGFSLLTKSGHSALTLKQAEATLLWWPLLWGALRFDTLTAHGPTLEFSRNAEGRLFVAGLPLDDGPSDGSMANWLLKQHSVSIQNATLIWRDEKRQAAPLVLAGVNFELDNFLFGRHQFELQVTPPAELAGTLTVSGELHGHDVKQLNDWSGKATLEVQNVNLAPWRAWISYPIDVQSGRGRIKLTGAFAKAQLNELDSTLALNNVSSRLAPDLELLAFSEISGQARWRQSEQSRELELSHLKLTTAQGGSILSEAGGRLQLHPSGGGELGLTKFTLPAVSGLMGGLPLPADVRKSLSSLRPHGSIDSFGAHWEGDWREPRHYQASFAFSGLGLDAPEPIPSVGLLDGEASVTESGGAVKLKSKHLRLTTKLFLEPLEFTELLAEAQWSRAKEKVEVTVPKLALANDHMSLSAKATYRYEGQGAGWLDLDALVPKAEASKVYKYIPNSVAPDTVEWLRTSLLTGHAHDAKFKLTGPLEAFPFDGDKNGIFRVDAKASGVELDYGKGWPRISNVGGDLLFHGNLMQIDTHSGQVFGARLGKVRSTIQSLEHSDSIQIEGEASGPTNDFLRYVRESPINEAMEGFLDHASAQGEGNLRLKLDIPLINADATKVQGRFAYERNAIDFGPQIPKLEQARGELSFTEKALQLKGGTAQILGGSSVLNVGTDSDGTVRIAATGKVDANLAARRYALPQAELIRGVTDYKADLEVRSQGTSVSIDSSLQGVALAAPAPLGKEASDSIPLRIQLNMAQGEADHWQVAYDKLVGADLYLRGSGKDMQIERGQINLGPTQLAARRQGLWVNGSLPQLNADVWHDFVGRLPESAGSGGGVATPPVSGVDLKLGKLQVFGKQLNQLWLRATPASGGWQMQVASKEATGNIHWNGQGRGKLVAKLSALHMPLPQVAGSAAAAVSNEEPEQLPAMDVTVEDFQYRDRKLGRLEVKAQQQRENWHIEKLSIANPEGRLDMDGVWRVAGNDSRTSVKVNVDSSNIGKLLERFGYPEAMRRGSGSLAGEVSWNGSPLSPDFASMSGSARIAVGPGQFSKIEPGVGRLLGILSLQSLPRRITLDFRDVFSEGFAFDKISGDSKISRGVIATDNLVIIGPAAQILFRGEADMGKETQKLTVRIVPTLSDSVALAAGVALANPIVGVTAFLLQKVLKDPIGQLVAYEYEITGKWEDPKIVRVGSGETVELNADKPKEADKPTVADKPVEGAP